MVKFGKFVEKVDALNGIYLKNVGCEFAYNEEEINEKTNAFRQLQKEVKSGMYKEKEERLNKIINSTMKLLSNYYVALKY